MPEFFEDMTIKLPIMGGRRKSLGVGKGSSGGCDVVAEAVVLDDNFTANVLRKISWHMTAGYPSTQIKTGEMRPDGKPKYTTAYLHHLVYEHYKGKRPLGRTGKQIDHEDRNRLNALPENLRSASQGIQKANSKARKNSSGCRGVRQTACGRWTARITIDYKETHLGVFATKPEAARAVNGAYRKAYPNVAIPNPSFE